MEKQTTPAVLVGMLNNPRAGDHSVESGGAHRHVRIAYDYKAVNSMAAPYSEDKRKMQYHSSMFRAITVLLTLGGAVVPRATYGMHYS